MASIFQAGLLSAIGRSRVQDGNKEQPKLEINRDQAWVVVRIFNEILEGKGLIEVAKQLNKEGIAGPRGKGWMKTTIHTILTNEVYTGTLVWGRYSTRDLPVVRVDQAWPAIIDGDTFKQVQSILRERAPVILHPKRVASRYLLIKRPSPMWSLRQGSSWSGC